MRIRFLATALVLAAAAAFSAEADAAKNDFKIKHIEPMNWWAGMANPDLQILVHADNIGRADAAIDCQGVQLVRTIKTDNPNYLFLDVRIAPEAEPGTFDIVFSVNGKRVANAPYELKQRKPGSAQRKGFDAADAVMLIMPDRFANADTTNDSMPGMTEKANRNEPYGRHGGDLEGIRKNLDYVANLGMTAVWLNPVQENNMPQSSYHGYAITDYYAVDARLGTLDEYRRLADECHSRGLKIIMDMVFNHCGTNHWWMSDLPSADWIFKWDGKPQISNFRLSTVADPHASQYDRRLTTEGWFDTSMADLNLGNPLVANYLIQNSIWWIETVGLDGIRQDTYPYPDKAAMVEWNLRVREEYPNFNIVGETWISQASKVCYWQKDCPNADGFNSELPVIMDFPLQEAISKAFTEQPGWSSGMMRLYESLADDHLYPNPYNLLVFGENHDVGRLINLVGGSVENLKLATAFIATVRGIPQLYIGTEVLMRGDGFAGHCFIREDFPGGWPADGQNLLSPGSRTADAADMYDFTARLFKYRKESRPLQWGTLTHFVPRNEVYVFFRKYENQSVMVVLNNSTDSQTLDTGIYAECLGGYSSATDIISGSRLASLDSITVGGKTAMVLELH